MQEPSLSRVDRLYKRHVEVHNYPLSYLALSIKLAIQDSQS